MAGPKVTIVDIANELGISKSTVANVLSEKGRFSDETRSLVHDAAARLGYVSNRAARSLRTNRAGAIGLYVPPVARTLAFYMEFAFGVAHAAELERSDLTLFAHSTAERRSFHVDGAIVIDPERDEPVVAQLVAAGIPVVTVGRYVGAAAPGIRGTLVARHDELQRRALDHAWMRGRRAPVFFAVDSVVPSSWGIGSRETFEAWCAEHGIRPVVREIPATATTQEMVDEFERALDEHGADSIVCGAQGWAARALIVAQARGLRVGDDLDVTTYVASPDEAAGDVITTIDLHASEYGEDAVRLLAEVSATGTGSSTPVFRHFEGATVSLAR